MRTQAGRDEVTLTIVSGLAVAVLVAAAVLGLGLVARASGAVSATAGDLEGLSVLAGVLALVVRTGRGGQARRGPRRRA